MTAPRIIGGAVEGGTSLSGITLSSDVSGGGLIAIDYQAIQLGNRLRDRLLFYNRLMIALQGGIRYCIVPFLTDYIAPCADSVFSTVFTGNSDDYIDTKFSDATTFSDGSTFTQPPVSGSITNNGSAGDGTVSLTVIGGRPLVGGEWFGVEHANGNFRAYNVTDVDSQVVNSVNGNVEATVGIRPTLRASTTAGQTIDWWRPRCTMRIRPGNDPQLILQQFWYSTPDLSFIEAF